MKPYKLPYSKYHMACDVEPKGKLKKKITKICRGKLKRDSKQLCKEAAEDQEGE